MRVFISEYTCGGAWPELETAGSLAVEGRAMLTAVVEDFSRVPGVRVTTTWDARLGPPPFENAHVVSVESPEDELATFHELADLSDATLVIAPEMQGVLARRCRLVEATRGRLLGPASQAVELCADKLALATHLESAGISTLRTAGCPIVEQSDSIDGPSLDHTTIPFPIVIKPRDGAGSQSTYLVRDAAEFARLRPVLEADPLLHMAVWQPYVCGQSVSVGVLISRDGHQIVVCPPAEQTLSDDGRFRYLGGVIPARGVDTTAIQAVAREACQAVRGLRGYLGFDLIVPVSAPTARQRPGHSTTNCGPNRPVVVEINPRLTTSYIGYRRLATENLAQRMLHLEDVTPISWRDGSVTFSADGTFR